LPGINTLAFYENLKITVVKSLMEAGPGVIMLWRIRVILKGFQKGVGVSLVSSIHSKGAASKNIKTLVDSTAFI